MDRLGIAYELNVGAEFHDFATEEENGILPDAYGAAFPPLNEAVGVRVKTDNEQFLFDAMGYFRRSLIGDGITLAAQNHLGLKVGAKYIYGEDQRFATGFSLLGGYQNTDWLRQREVPAAECGVELTQLFGIDGTNVGKMYVGPSAQVVLSTNGDVEADVGLKMYLGG